jgi:fused signal recognition particle receptor
MFGFIKDKLSAVYKNIAQKFTDFFSGARAIDEAFLTELEHVLIAADLGAKLSQDLIAHVRDVIKQRSISEPAEVKQILKDYLHTLLAGKTEVSAEPTVVLLVGINGTGKTSFAGKYAHWLVKNGKAPLLVAGDTFRAAAVDQLSIWSERVGCQIHAGTDNQDPASVIFDASIKFAAGGFDTLIIDTAGRLQTRVNLMKELEKIRRVVAKCLPDHKIQTWLTIDAMLGQNSLEQAEVFDQATQLDGLILTKADGTGRGGALFSIVDKLKVPVVYVTYGETIDDVGPFSAQEYVKGIFDA